MQESEQLPHTSTRGDVYVVMQCLDALLALIVTIELLAEAAIEASPLPSSRPYQHHTQQQQQG